LRVFDINLRPPFATDSVIRESLALANVLKLNEDELAVLKTLCGLSGPDLEVMRQLAGRFSLQAVALTRGANGAALLFGDQVSEQEGIRTEVVDTVGAGDAFSAALTIGLLERRHPQTIIRTACELAAYVCSQAGATPKIPKHLAVRSTP